MKIIGTTQTGFLVEATSREIARAAGFYSEYDALWHKSGAADAQGMPRIGATIKIEAALDFHARIAAEQKKARDAASTLRALAGLLDGAMPDVVLPPTPTAAQEG